MEEHLVGRDDELARLDDLLAGPGGALVLRGGPGVGKSTLLDRVVRGAAEREVRTVQAIGAEAETGLPYAGLHQVLYPLARALDGMDPEHTRVLRSVLDGRQEDRPTGALQLAVAVLDLLTVSAGNGGLLVAADDAQWFDAPSADVLAIVARRLPGSPVHLVLAARDDAASAFDTAGLPELVVGPLGPGAAAALLDETHPALDAALRQQVLDEADGNALALVELPRGAGSVAGTASGTTLALPRRLERLYAERLDRVPAPEREELLRAALDGVTAGRGAARGGGRYTVDESPAAAREALVRLDPASGAWAFAHPLVRSAVVSAATARERHAAHLYLARWHVHDVQRRALHLAAGTVDPDEDAAAVIEAAARLATAQGAAATAVGLLQRAAELSERAPERARRLADASFLAGQAGLLRQAEQLVDRSTTDSPASLITGAYVSLYQDGDVTTTSRLVLAALDEADQTDDATLDRMVNLQLAIGQFSLDPELWRRTDAIVDRHSARLPETTRIYRDTWGDVARRGQGARARLDTAFATLGQGEPWDVMRLGVAAFYVDALPEYRPFVRRMVEREEESGAAGNVMTLLQLVMLDQIDSGSWDEAETTGQRGLALTREHGYGLFGQQFRAFLAYVAAARGRDEEAQRYLAEVERWARPRRVGFLVEWVETVNAVLAAGRGDFESAWVYATGVSSPGELRPYSHQAPRMLWALVEAAVHTGRTADAVRHAQAATEMGLADLSPRTAMLTDAATAATTDDESLVRELYERAVSCSAASEFPFDGARIQLAYGMWLRRVRSTTTAREMLTRALDTFTALGAEPWAERTRQELRAAGTVIRQADASAGLTAQERQVAELAARGLSNKEIGAQLFLSPRTVGAHLYRIYPKLGITSRASLRDALSTGADA
ncbi:ATP-binding protein [Promicromonospora sukumoe]|uniref:ATP-binding protein n=1 Tax=Promicromonospora sukumoe TaxID=88382 RepID=UPI0003A3A225|nr:AAA family ATPase [Promicromonospora sukumoe]